MIILLVKINKKIFIFTLIGINFVSFYFPDIFCLHKISLQFIDT